MDSEGWFASSEEVRVPMRTGCGETLRIAPLPASLDSPSRPPHPAPAAFLKGLSDKQREEHYFCRDFIRLKKIPTWKETAKGRPAGEAILATGGARVGRGPLQSQFVGELYRQGPEKWQQHLWSAWCVQDTLHVSPHLIMNAA